MDELPPKAAALLRAARREHDPSRTDSERVRHSLVAALAAPTLGDAGEQALTMGKSASRWLSAGWIKGVAVVGLVAGATLFTTWRPAQKPAHAPVPRAASVPAPSAASARSAAGTTAHAATQHSGERGAAPELPAPTDTTVPAPASEHTSHSPAREPVPSAAPRARPRAQAVVQGAVASTSSAVLLARGPARSDTLPAVQHAPGPEQAPGELALMRRALERLNAGDPDGALEQLGLHAARFPNGVMTEERDGLRAVAWCKGGDTVRGSAAAHSFLRLYPDSPLGARVRGACKDGSP